MSVDVARVRGVVPALGDGWVHLDAPGGMQVPEPVATVVSAALRAPVAPPGGSFPASRRAGKLVDGARRAVADLVGAEPKGVVLGPSVPTLLGRLADALADGWDIGDEVVVSRLDTRAAVTPWRRAARRVGGILRTAEVDVETGELPSWQYDDLLGERTRVAAVTAACPYTGTRTEVAAVARKVHALPAPARGVEPLVVVDATAAAPYLPLDLETMGADVLAVSVAAWGGPAVGALAFRSPELLERLPADPSDPSDPAVRGAERLEPADLPLALLAGVAASVDHLADLDSDAVGPRRDRVLESMSSLRAHLDELTDHLVSALRLLPGVTVIGDPRRRIPTVALTVAGRPAREVAERVADRGVCVLTHAGDEGALEVIGVAEVGGVVRVGLAPYTSRADVDALVRALGSC